jgi:hypothetical protein
MIELIIGAAALYFLTRPSTTANTPTEPTGPTGPVDFTAFNVSRFKTEPTTSVFDKKLAQTARRVTPDGTGKAIIDGSYICMAPGSADRVAKIKRVYQQLDELRIKIQNSTGDRKQEYKRDLLEKDNERAILVAEHYMICEKFYQDQQAQPKNNFQNTVDQQRQL